jgi:hypothetical protein
LVLLFHAVLLRHAAQAIPSVLDSDVAEAAAAVAATIETARKGVIYQHEPSSIPAARLAAAFRDGLAALKPEASRIARLEADAAMALRRIERGARTAEEVLKGDDAPIFINVVKRLMSESAGPRRADPGELAAGPASDGGPLIVPG